MRLGRACFYGSVDDWHLKGIFWGYIYPLVSKHGYCSWDIPELNGRLNRNNCLAMGLQPTYQALSWMATVGQDMPMVTWSVSY